MPKGITKKSIEKLKYFIANKNNPEFIERLNAIKEKYDDELKTPPFSFNKNTSIVKFNDNFKFLGIYHSTEDAAKANGCLARRIQSALSYLDIFESIAPRKVRKSDYLFVRIEDITFDDYCKIPDKELSTIYED